MDDLKSSCLVCGSPTRLFLNKLYDDRYGASGYYSVRVCKKCGFGRLDPLLNKHDTGRFYEKHYPLLKVDAERLALSATKKIPNILKWVLGIDNVAHEFVKKKNVSCLEIGSGSGFSLLQLRNNGIKGYGVEPDGNAQSVAKKLELEVFKGFLSDNPFPDLKFDYITGSQVIEHETEPVQFLSLAYKRLEKDGILILSFPNIDSIYRKVYGRYWINWHVPYHCNFFNQRSFVKVAGDAGFRIKKMRTITPNLWTVFQIFNLFYLAKYRQKGSLWDEHFGRIGEKILFFSLLLLITPINRTVDLLGYGDSLLVFLEKDERS